MTRSKRFPSQDAATIYATQHGLTIGRKARSSDEALAHIAASSAYDAETGCLLWQLRLTNVGYAAMTWTPAGRAIVRGGHRVVYTLTCGDIPDGMQLDHLCRTRHCVRPDHLEVVTPRENIMRSPIAQGALNAAKTHCPQGHAYTPENTLMQFTRGRAGRTCRTCLKVRNARKAVA